MNVAVDQGVEGVVVALSDALARMELRADLADEDIARPNLLAAEPLYTAALGIRVASVSAGALSFFMCHVFTTNFSRDASDPEKGGAAPAAACIGDWCRLL